MEPVSTFVTIKPSKTVIDKCLVGDKLKQLLFGLAGCACDAAPSLVAGVHAGGCWLSMQWTGVTSISCVFQAPIADS